MTTTLWIMVALIALVFLLLAVFVWAFRLGVREGAERGDEIAALLTLLEAKRYMLMPNIAHKQWVICTTDLNGPSKILFAGRYPLDALRGLGAWLKAQPDPPAK